jgi:hypothetical protein
MAKRESMSPPRILALSVTATAFAKHRKLQVRIRSESPGYRDDQRLMKMLCDLESVV